MMWLLGDDHFTAKDLEGLRRVDVAVRMDHRSDPRGMRYADVY